MKRRRKHVRVRGYRGIWRVRHHWTSKETQERVCIVEPAGGNGARPRARLVYEAAVRS